MPISNANAGNLLNYVHKVVGNNIVKNELSLLAEVYCVEIFWCGSNIVPGAGAASWFEPIVLNGDEPGKSEQIGNNNVRSHHVEHSFLALEVEHENGHEQQNESTIR